MNNERKELIPDLRFPEFVNDEEWEKRPLGDFLDYLQPTNYLVTSTLYDDEFKTPVLTAGKTFILGYTDETTGIFAENLPIIIFDDFTTAVQYVDFPFKAKSSAMKILLPKGDASIKFFYESIQNINYISGAHQRHWISIFSKIKVPVPKNYLEQQKIASCLSSLDELITAQKEKLELLKNHKKGLMQNLFPQEGETVPKFRFPEFENNGEWEEKKLGDITENVMYGMNASAIRYDGENKYIRITDIDENSRTFLQNSLTSPNGQLEEKYILKIGDLLFARTGASVGKSYLHQKENGKIYFAGFLIRLTIKNEIPYFIYAQTLTDQYFKWVIKTSMRSGQPGLNAEEYKSYRVFIPPSINEQEKIVSGLSSLDELISSEKERLEKLQLHKKGLMQGLFPKIID